MHKKLVNRMTAKPSAIVFDVGNVLIQWDMSLLYGKIFDEQAAMEAFLTETDLFGWNLEQDRGRTWQEAEAELIPRFPHYEAQIRAFRDRWHEMVPGAIEETVDLKAQLKSLDVPLYAITNFAADTFAETQERFPTLKDFIDIVISGDEKLVKPDPAIYRVLLERNALKAEDCLFIDDSLPNVEGARSVGMMAHHFKGPEGLRDELRQLGFDV